MKTNGSAKKRFKISPSGVIKRRKAFKSHILTKKSPKRKRNLRQGAIIEAVDLKMVRRLLAKA